MTKIHWWPPIAFDGWGSSQTKWEEDHVYQTNLVSEVVWWGRQSQMPLQSLTESCRSVSRPASRCLPISLCTKRSWLTRDFPFKKPCWRSYSWHLIKSVNIEARSENLVLDQLIISCLYCFDVVRRNYVLVTNRRIPRQNFSLLYLYNILQTSDENKGKYQLWDE